MNDNNFENKNEKDLNQNLNRSAEDEIEIYIKDEEDMQKEVEGFSFNKNGRDNNDSADNKYTQYYSEQYEQDPKKKKKKKKKRPRTKASIGSLLMTSFATALIVSVTFLAVSPLLTPTLESFWGIEREKEIIYIESGDDGNIDNLSFEKTSAEDEKNANDVKLTDQNGQIIKIEVDQDDSTVTKIAKIASPSVVGIKVSYDFFSYFFGEQTNTGEGSGIILSSDGHIITNYHVIQEAVSSQSTNAKIEVFLHGDTDKSYEAQIVGYESSKDLAVLKIEADDLVPAQIGDSDDLEVGELAVAIGSPGGIGLIGSVTSGIVSGLNRELPLDGVEDMNLIQTDAAINPGNSGGALLNSKGQVIGINEAKITATGFEGLGFAIPINLAMEVYQNILENKTTEKNILFGIYVEERYTKEFAESSGYPVGILVKDVIPTTGAYKAGIKVNDIITKWDGEELDSIDKFNNLKNEHEVGDVVEIEIFRENDYITIEVELMENFEMK